MWKYEKENLDDADLAVNIWAKKSEQALSVSKLNDFVAEPDLRLPFLGAITTTPGVLGKTFPAGSIAGIPLHIKGSGHGDPESPDFCPAWFAKQVNKPEHATFRLGVEFLEIELPPHLAPPRPTPMQSGMLVAFSGAP